MRRGFWFAAGAGAGLYAAVRGQRVLDTFTADGLRMRLQALGVGARMLRDEVAAGKADAEPALRERFRPAHPDTPALTASAGARVELDERTTEEDQEGKQ